VRAGERVIGVVHAGCDFQRAGGSPRLNERADGQLLPA
jgi:hypothetical protein